MFYCAYELNIPNLDLLKEEWKQFWPEQPSTWQGSTYLNHKNVGPQTAELYRMFDNCFLNNMRFIKAPAKTVWGKHMDIDVEELDYFDGEIPSSSIRAATINFLLSPPDENKTKFFTDSKCTKHDWNTHYSHKGTEEWKLVDEKLLGEKPQLINTGQWHSIDITHERWMVGLHFSPLVSFQGAVEYCRHKGFLIER